MNDLKTPAGVLALMKSSKTGDEWNRNCDAVKKANGGGYPDFWYETILRSGVARTTMDAMQDGSSERIGIVQG